MLSYILNILLSYGLNFNVASILSNIILLMLIGILGAVIKLFVDKVLLNILSNYINKSEFKWDDILVKRKVFIKASHIIPPIFLYFFIQYFSIEFQGALEKIITTYITIVMLVIAISLLDSLNDIYYTLKISKSKPIKGFVQVLKILIYAFGVIVIVANVLNKSPVIILSGIGALAAVLLIVFKDSLLGLVSGIQIATNDMVRIGDWIEMPKYDANGEVLDISLNTVKVENFDKTITNIPSYSLVSDSFKNWRNMEESGGRRIKRAIYIDTNSIKFCDERMIEKFKNIQYIKDYVILKEKEIKEYIQEQIDPTESINLKKLTNIGAFREYIQQYLANNPNIHKKMIQMVRALQPGINGVPLEIYAFTNDTDWLNYERIQADIFEHIISVASEFDIRLFQNPTGYDMKIVLNENKI